MHVPTLRLSNHTYQQLHSQNNVVLHCSCMSHKFVTVVPFIKQSWKKWCMARMTYAFPGMKSKHSSLHPLNSNVLFFCICNQHSHQRSETILIKSMFIIITPNLFCRVSPITRSFFQVFRCSTFWETVDKLVRAKFRTQLSISQCILFFTTE